MQIYIHTEETNGFFGFGKKTRYISIPSYEVSKGLGHNKAGSGDSPEEAVEDFKKRNRLSSDTDIDWEFKDYPLSDGCPFS